MDVHKNAPLTPIGREIMVRRMLEGGQTPQAVSEAVGVCPRTVRKWVDRFRAEGVAGLQDRSSRPHRLRKPTPIETVTRIEALRRQRWTGEQIARETGVSKATVFRVLRRLGLNRLKALEPAEPIRRYEREHPGELLHIDTKKLGKIDGIGHRITGDRRGRKHGGWEYLHVCIDDASRLAYTEILPDERKERAIDFLHRALAWFATLGITVERIMTDNGNAYRSRDFQAACRSARLTHIRTKPYTPKTNGKAERFIQTALREWAYAQAYTHSDGRTEELPRWLHRYNWHRPHSSIGARAPISRLRLTENNLLRLHT